MARKYDRYGLNRQFRRNPTRSPKFFPYRLPFQPDFRLLNNTGTEVSAATASRWRQVVADITNPNKRKREYDEDEEHGWYKRMQYTQTPIKNGRNSALGAIGDSMLGVTLSRAAQGLLAKDIAEIGLRGAILTGIIAI